MALVQKTVDPDGGGDYVSLNAWNAAEATDLVSDGDTHEVSCECSSGSADTVACTIGALDWNQNSSYYFTIKASSGHEAVKTSYDTSRYRLEVTDDDVMDHSSADGNEVIDGIQFKFVYSSGTHKSIMQMHSFISGMDVITYKNCRVVGENASSVCRGWALGDVDLSLKIENCITELCDRFLIYCSQTSFASIKIYNSIFAHQDYSNGKGLNFNNATGITIKNCAVFDTQDDFYDTTNVTIDYCGSDDNDGTNSQTPSGGDWDNEYNDPDNGDYTALAGGNIEDNGVGPETDADVPTIDIDGTTRAGASCDIGCDEITSTGNMSINVNDALTMQENITTNMPLPGISVSDTVQLSEQLGRDLPLLPYITDNIGVVEVVNMLLSIRASISDTMTINELVNVLMSIRATVSDTMSIAEIIDVTVSALADLQTNISDSITISEVAAVAQSDMLSNTVDTLGITEIINIIMTIRASVSDTITINEDLTVDVSTISNLEAAASDSMSLTEVLTLLMDIKAVASDNITLVETIQILKDMSINVTDNMAIAESVNVKRSSHDTNIFDTITIAEYLNVFITTTGTINVNDTISLVENIDVVLEIVNLVINNQYESYSIVSDGSNYHIFSHYN